jgi:hypothetical protein
MKMRLSKIRSSIVLAIPNRKRSTTIILLWIVIAIAFVLGAAIVAVFGPQPATSFAGLTLQTTNHQVRVFIDGNALVTVYNFEVFFERSSATLGESDLAFASPDYVLRPGSAGDLRSSSVIRMLLSEQRATELAKIERGTERWFGFPMRCVYDRLLETTDGDVIVAGAIVLDDFSYSRIPVRFAPWPTLLNVLMVFTLMVCAHIGTRAAIIMRRISRAQCWQCGYPTGANVIVCPECGSRSYVLNHQNDEMQVKTS